MLLNCKVIKTSGTPPPPLFYINPPFSGLTPLSSKKFRPPPQVTEFLEGPTPSFNKRVERGGRGSNYVLTRSLTVNSRL